MRTAHLYIHVPFCARRCTYCDFSIAVRRRIPVGEYLDALELEARGTRGARDDVELDTVYLGGGTPSLLSGEGIASLVARLGIGRVAREFTIEANPDDVTYENARQWARAGINRLSLGAQSFDDRVLAWMHRTHDADATREAARAARAAGIVNLSLDLIFALPESLGRDWALDLEAALALEPDQVSLYGLTLEPGTALFRRTSRGELMGAPETRYEEEYLLAHERLGAAGYAFYEVSNAARPGREAVHNSAYWRLAPYLGLGPSAHSFDGTARWWNEPTYVRWRRRLDEGVHPIAGREILNEHQRALEQIYLGLRTREGIRLDGSGAGGLGTKAERWVAAGWAERYRVPGAGEDRLRLTPGGWLRLDELVASI